MIRLSKRAVSVSVLLTILLLSATGCRPPADDDREAEQQSQDLTESIAYQADDLNNDPFVEGSHSFPMERVEVLDVTTEQVEEDDRFVTKTVTTYTDNVNGKTLVCTSEFSSVSIPDELGIVRSYREYGDTGCPVSQRSEVYCSAGASHVRGKCVQDCDWQGGSCTSLQCADQGMIWDSGQCQGYAVCHRRAEAELVCDLNLPQDALSLRVTTIHIDYDDLEEPVFMDIGSWRPLTHKIVLPHFAATKATLWLEIERKHSLEASTQELSIYGLMD